MTDTPEQEQKLRELVLSYWLEREKVPGDTAILAVREAFEAGREQGRRASVSAEQLAEMFHEAYEAKAENYGYKTRAESNKPWKDVPINNKLLMIATCEEVLARLAAPTLEEVLRLAEGS